MAYSPGSTVHGSFDTHDPDTGSLADADTLPVVAVYRNGVAEPTVAVTLAHDAVGVYGYSFSVPSDWSSGDTVEARRFASVGGVSDMDADTYILTATGTATDPDTWDGYFATDADVAAAVASEDYGRIAPANQAVAEGTDGVIPAGGFTLTSAENPSFANRGVIPGMVLRVRDSGVGTADLFAISDVDGGTLTLRRIGLGDGEGEPPGEVAGLTAISFDVLTFRRQLEVATEWLSSLTGQEPGSTTIPTRMLHATVAKVASDAYGRIGDTFTPGTHGGGPWQLKAAKHRADLNAELSLIRVKVEEAATAAGVTNPKLPQIGRFRDCDDWIIPRAW